VALPEIRGCELVLTVVCGLCESHLCLPAWIEADPSPDQQHCGWI